MVGSLKFLQMDREGITDRVYRLHYNKSQQRTDLFAGVSHRLGGVGWGGVPGVVSCDVVCWRKAGEQEVMVCRHKLWVVGCSAVGGTRLVAALLSIQHVKQRL